jgi:hypothetical protein
MNQLANLLLVERHHQLLLEKKKRMVCMSAYLLAGLSVGLVVFATLFISCLLVLVIIARAVQIAARVYRTIFTGQPGAHRKQPSRSRTPVPNTIAQF